MTKEPLALKPAKADVAVCPRCHGAGFVRDDAWPGDPTFGKALPCVCQIPLIAARRYRQAQIISDAVPPRVSFDEYNVTYNPEALAAARDWAMGCASAPHTPPAGSPVRGERAGSRQDGWSPWLLLRGGYGTGKTYLLTAAFYALLDAGRQPIYTVSPLLLDSLREGIQSGDYSERFYAVKDCPALILDDLGAESPTAWAREALYKVVDYRYRLGLPLAVATNCAVEQLEPRVADRLHDSRLSRVVRLSGPSWRLR
jgi:DNA replication protein DnaC